MWETHSAATHITFLFLENLRNYRKSLALFYSKFRPFRVAISAHYIISSF
jgi:hypothetical protein